MSRPGGRQRLSATALEFLGGRSVPAAGGGAGPHIMVIGVAGAAALLLVAMLTIPMMVAGGAGMLFAAGSGCPGGGAPAAQAAASAQAKNSIPASYLALYQKIGRQYGVPWVILAGIGTVESDNGQSSAPGVHSGANAFGAAGPMQIGVGGTAGDVWGGAPVHPAGVQVSGVATDADGNGVASVYDPADAIAGAAKYLVEHGVQSDAPAAIFAYNHLQSYVQDVLYYADVYASGGYSVAYSAGQDGSGSAGGTAACLQQAGTGGSAAAPSQAAAAAIGYAEQQLGKPYEWGSTGPDAFDCSGLVMMAYRAAGVDIPRTSQQQWAWGPRVRPGHEEPGDLVFFAGADGTPASPGHVGLVIGRGKMIEGYAAGTPIRIASYGTPGSPPGDQHPVGFTRPWAHAGSASSIQQPAP